MYNHLQTGTYAITSNNIYPAHDDHQIKKDGYPEVVIQKPEITKSLLTMGVHANMVKQADVMFVIEVRHNSAANLRTVVDQIDDKITTGLQVFRDAGLYPQKDGFITESYDEFSWGSGKRQHLCAMSINFRYIGSS